MTELFGIPVRVSDELQTPAITFGDWSAYMATIVLNDTTPIQEAVEALGLPEEVLTLPAVRTLGDLRVVLERGEVEKVLAQKIKKALPS